MRGMAEDAAVHRNENAVGDQPAPGLSRQPQLVEVGDGQEAEQLTGPPGDGPVEVTGHGGAL
jgi:hypothetical protein